MKVIMLKDVGGVGRRGEIITISDGYALNALIPKGQAEQATADKIAAWEKRHQASQAQEAQREQEWAAIAKKLENSTIQVHAKTNESGHLYQQLSPSFVAEAIERVHGVRLPPDGIMFAAPIKKLGLTEIKVRLGKTTTSLKLDVTGA